MGRCIKYANITRVIQKVTRPQRVKKLVSQEYFGAAWPVCIFTNPTLIELRQEIGQYDWLASPRANDVVLCSHIEIITKQAIECGL
ncbi:hypothetical protein AVEN_44270-1 [Araneus ventricosus]|uniref:Uncharacterized protein n=1 Tax=Araneus ventricosus TaxID=182803 RepID=A0A4Y2W5X0_ARAVE|nr:hypothetical protein AVEN_44270-1 [Araneus ventricosus]